VTPTVRHAARVLVIDNDGCVLLFRGFDPARPEAGDWWFTPGGGIDGDESVADAARRELYEETGLAIDDLGPELFESRIIFEFEGKEFDQFERFFCVRTPRFDLTHAGFEPHERRSVLEHRWWSGPELAATAETIYPQDLAERIARLLD